ncbi:hypothetical protein QTP88_029026 [Uroleucon formosanum]
MSDQPSCSKASVGVSPVKKNAKGKFVCSRQKETIINVYKTILLEQPNIKYKELVQSVCKTSGIGRNTVSKTISDYKNVGVLKSPNKTKIRAKIIDKIDDFEKNAVRSKVHNFWFQRQIPTIDKILVSVNEDPDLPNFSRASLHRLLKDLNFEYSKRGRNSAMIEKDEIVIWRNKYLEQLRKYRSEGRAIYYLDETWLNAGDVPNKIWVDRTIQSSRDAFLKGLSTGAAKPSGKGKRLIVLHIGSEDGFVPGGLLSFQSIKDTGDYHNEMNGDTFFDWMKEVLPLPKDNCVIVMDNAPYHSVKTESSPTVNWKKADIEMWLEEKGEIFEKPMIKVRLMEMVKRLKPMYNKYVIDEYVNEHNKIILRLPPYHCELNPIELAWSVVKKHVRMNNTTFKLDDVQKLLHDGINQCTPGMWKNFIQHTKKEEEKFWKIDFVVEEVLENMGSTVMTITGKTSSEFSTDDDDAE